MTADPLKAQVNLENSDHSKHVYHENVFALQHCLAGGKIVSQCEGKYQGWGLWLDCRVNAKQDDRLPFACL